MSKMAHSFYNLTVSQKDKPVVSINLDEAWASGENLSLTVNGLTIGCSHTPYPNSPKQSGLKPNGVRISDNKIQRGRVGKQKNKKPLLKSLKKAVKKCTGFFSTGTSSGETKCREYLEEIFDRSFDKIRPDWLNNPVTNCNLELDCYNDELKLALEYNGKQHYDFIPFFHKTKQNYQAQLYRDVIKRLTCEKMGIKLIEVPYTISLDSLPDFIDQAVKKLDLEAFLVK